MLLDIVSINQFSSFALLSRPRPDPQVGTGGPSRWYGMVDRGVRVRD